MPVIFKYLYWNNIITFLLPAWRVSTFNVQHNYKIISTDVDKISNQNRFGVGLTTVYLDSFEGTWGQLIALLRFIKIIFLYTFTELGNNTLLYFWINFEVSYQFSNFILTKFSLNSFNYCRRYQIQNSKITLLNSINWKKVPTD